MGDTVTELAGRARKQLRGFAHHVRPAVQIGKDGLTEAVLRSIDEALGARELIKVQFVGVKEGRRELAAEIDSRLLSTCVGLVGHVAILYRQHPDPARRTIHLPDHD